MPFNSFDDYPMAWRPNRSDLRSPLYLSLADLLEQDIKTGKLLSNAKLPPQRELADFLDINHSTVTRAYKLCEMRGLVHAVVGSGTFVAPNIGVKTTIAETEDPTILDMGMVLPFYEHNVVLRDTALSVLKKPLSDKLFEYSSPFGTDGQKLAGVKWLEALGVQAELDQLIITPGTQNALAVTLLSLLNEGDRIATDVHTYPNLIGLARMLHIQLVAVESDKSGMKPDALNALCRTVDVKAVFLVPSCNNPTIVSMPETRRTEIAEVVKQNDLLVIEDDVYAFFDDSPQTSIQSLVPEKTIYLSGLSKPISAGLRITYLLSPAQYVESLNEGYTNLNIKTSSLTMEIAAEIIHSGASDKIVEQKRQLAVERNTEYYRLFPSETPVLRTMFQWLELPEGCSGKEFEDHMLTEGVRVYGSERFSVGNAPESNYIRIATCSPKTLEELTEGLTKVQHAIEQW